MRTRLPTWAAVVVCLALVAGCNAASTDSRVLVGKKTDNSMLALFRGKVQMVGGCLGVENTVVIWPYGTRVVDRDPLTITVPDTGRVRVGQWVDLGGGFVARGRDHYDLINLRRAFPNAPKSCAQYDVFAAG